MHAACVLAAVVVAGLLATAGRSGAETDFAATPLEGSLRFPDQTIPFQESVALTVPALPAKPGKTLLLRLRIVSFTEQSAGCNYNAALLINDTPLGRFTSGGDERLLGRPPMFEFAKGSYPGAFQVFSGVNLMTMFAPNPDAGDAMTKDGRGATFVLDISDAARGVDGNTLTLRNIRKPSALSTRLDLLVSGIEIGWLDKGLLPQPAERIPTRGAIAASVSSGALKLSQAAAGGFVLTGPSGLDLLVETGWGMTAAAESALRAEDAPEATPSVTVEPFGPCGYRVKADLGKARLVRTLELRDGLLHWKERWTGAGDGLRGMPFRHRVFLRGEAARFRLAGDSDVGALAGTATNPTVYLESRAKAGHGFGVTLESDVLRLVAATRNEGGLGEIYSTCFALAGGTNMDFDLTIAPVSDGGGYWTFINGLRRRWGVNGFCVPHAIFWGYSRAPGGSLEEVAAKSLGSLGPVFVAFGPWARLGPDAAVVRSGRYPKLAEGAPRTAGQTPDLDLDAWLTFKHRDAYWTQYAREVAAIHTACPQVKVMQITHPAMEVVYRPLGHRWPYASEEILTAAGKPFEEMHYSRAHLGDWAGKDWGVYYYVPRPGSEYLQALLESVRRSLDDCGGDGIYFDEFSWAGRRRDYSRYDYGRWDGFSADLNEAGEVARLKSDNGYVTESAQIQLIAAAVSRGKLFLANGNAGLRSLAALPMARFAEGGNGYGPMASMHLARVPLVLGNFGDEKSRKGVFEAVKEALTIGCVYSPSAVNLLFDSPDNFVCKLYPLTVREIGPGAVLGEERLITVNSGAYAWPGRAASVRLFQYNDQGDLIGKDTVIRAKAGEPLRLDVPAKGLLIAEIAP